MTGTRAGLARSVQVRLARHAKAIGVDPNLVLTRYGVERFLYRLSLSRHAEQFVLKGALLLLVWLGETLRRALSLAIRQSRPRRLWVSGLSPLAESSTLLVAGRLSGSKTRKSSFEISSGERSLIRLPILIP